MSETELPVQPELSVQPEPSVQSTQSKLYKYSTPREEMFDATQKCWCVSNTMVRNVYHRCALLGGRMGAYVEEDGIGTTLFRGDPEEPDDAPPSSNGLGPA